MSTPATPVIKPGYLPDFVSGQPVRDTPEERDAVQVFARRLVEDFGYPKNLLQTRPQHRVRKAPSDEAKSYPVDIAVFRRAAHVEDELFLLVECKQRTRKDGLAQLKLYLDMSAAEVGVWFNGDEHVYLRKVHHRDGRRTYETLPAIPRHGQRIEDIGRFLRRELRKPSNLKADFRDLRNHLAGMTTGITRDEPLAQEIINLLFCKILDEQETEPGSPVTFRAGVGEPVVEIQRRILTLFERVKTATYEDVFAADDTLNLDADSLAYVVGELQNYAVMEADRDAIGDAFEVFIGPALRGAEGQFFTPRNVVKMMVDILDPRPGEKIIDPACGSGGFLIAALEHVWGHLRTEAARKGWNERQRFKREIEVATDCFRGIDKDAFLAKVCKAYMALIGDGRGGVFCANSLARPEDWQPRLRDKIGLGEFDVILTNPPFGQDIAVKGAPLLAQYSFGHRWKRNKETKGIEQTEALHDQQPPQLLFLERCLQLLKPGGRLGIVLPESILGNPSYEHVHAFLAERATLELAVTMPEALFKTSGKGGTHTKVAVLVIRNVPPQGSRRIFMADAKWCGHDSRANPTYRKNTEGKLELLDDVPVIADRYRRLGKGERIAQDHLGFYLDSAAIKHSIYVPKYYAPEIDARLASLSKTHDLPTVAELIARKHLSIVTGIEIGKMAYGTGRIPFIRTSDLSNWEIKADFKHGVSEAIYEEADGGSDVKVGDILMVRDGTYLVGTTAIVTAGDLPMLFQSHLFRLRALIPEKLDPYLLLACLNTPLVKAQIRSKQFTQDIIDTLGKRIGEIVVPIPKNAALRAKVAHQTKELVETRALLRERARKIPILIEGSSSVLADFLAED